MTVHIHEIEESTDEDLNEEDETPIDDENPAPEEVDIEDLLGFSMNHTLAQRESRFQ